MGDRGRPRKYLTVEAFEKFKNNDFYHLQCAMKTDRKLLWIILAALIGSALFDRLIIIP